jgi:hypothetical protein
VTTAKKTVADYPHLVDQWHTTKNGDVRPEHIAAGTKKKVWWLCAVCQHEWAASPQKRTLGRGCPGCAGTTTTLYNSLEFIDPDLSMEVCPTEEYPFGSLDVTANSRRLISWCCGSCGHQWVARVCSRTYMKTGCPKCKLSKLEKIVADILAANNVQFKIQWKSDLCKNKKNLPFDFAIMVNEEICGLIECQGIQHFRPKNFGSKTKTKKTMYEEITANDKIKREYCFANNIPLLEVHYGWEKIENKIKEEVYKFLAILGVERRPLRFFLNGCVFPP